ncbi:MAG: tetratricopeptide repeat protein [Bryobacteraceae bacterium]
MRKSLWLPIPAALAFGASLCGSFHFDDYSLFSNPVLASHAGWWEVWKPFQTRPLTWFTFWLSEQFGGRNPVGYHAVNLALHFAAILLLFDALSRMLSPRAALVATALFAIHPLQAEAVNYIFARSTLLAAVLCLASLDTWVRGHRWIAVMWFATALAAKEECAAFPIFLLLLHLVFSRARRELPPLAAMFVLSIAAGARLLLATKVTPGSAAGFAAGLSPWSYFAAQGIVILRYLRLLIVPWGFTVDPAISPAAEWLAMLAWAAIAALAAIAFLPRWRARAGFWFLAGLILLSPTSAIVPVADLAADRRMYLPMIAFCACLGLLLEGVDLRVLGAAGVILIGLSFAQTQVWRTEASLWTQAVERAPYKVRPTIQLARAVEPSRALELLQQARELEPDNEAVAAEQGRVYLETGNLPQALVAFGRALALAPHDPQALNNRGAALLAMGQQDAARADFERALTLNVCLDEARMNLRRAGVETATPEQCPK